MKQFILLTIIGLGFISSQRPTPSTEEMDILMNAWHKAAAEANGDFYFGLMDESFVFLGTDPNERWGKEAFMAFCKPHFEKGKGWDFKTIERHWSFSKDKKTAWFDEKIDTWMKDCRGSGVMIKKGKEWYLTQYNLAVLIENDKIQSFIELREKE
ncbi:MAG: nuclear transport factor 2 family protein [Fluviicola sp.]|nr:nuclear transport factor 2 family protein [Fluviicola sp.]